MRRVIVFIIALITFILLLYNYIPEQDGNGGLGGGDQDAGGGQITVFVFVDGERKEIVMRKDSSLNLEDIPTFGKTITGLYYDPEYKYRYMGEAIGQSTTLYAKTGDGETGAFTSIAFTLHENESMTNPGYSGIELIMLTLDFDAHFATYPSAVNRVAFVSRFDDNFFVENAVIVLYALAGAEEADFSVNEVRKAGATLDVNLAFRSGAEAEEKTYLLFAIEVKKRDVSGINNLTISVTDLETGGKKSRYYGDPNKKREAEVPLITGADRAALTVPLNSTVKATDVPRREYYEDIIIYEDAEKTVPYNEPLKEDKVLYVSCRLRVFTVAFIIGERVEFVTRPAGMVLSLDDVPPQDGETYIGLFYDERFRVPYDDAPLTGSTVIYVKSE